MHSLLDYLPKAVKGLSFSRNNNFLVIENTTANEIKFAFKTTVKCSDSKYLCIKSIVDASDYDLLRSFLVITDLHNNNIYSFRPDSTRYLKISNNCKIFLKVGAKSKLFIKLLNYEIIDEVNTLFDTFQNDVLLISPGYPEKFNKYWCAFIHSRVLGYKKNGLKVDVVIANNCQYENIRFYSYEDVDVCDANFSFLRELLLNKKYKKILVHFVEPSILKILEYVDTTSTQIFLYSHGVDTTYKDYKILHATYQKTIYDEYTFPLLFAAKDEIIKRFNNKSNVTFVFVSNWVKDRAEKLLDIKFKNCAIVPCFIDDAIFIYKKPNPDLRKKIVIIRPQHNLSSYSLDISVRVILELSRKSYFNDLTFSIYGTGSEHNWLFAPLRKFTNVFIYDKFLSASEMAQVYNDSGICLLPSRYDTQCVVACEAAMSGKIVISSHGTGLKEYIDENTGLYCETENIDAYVKKIEFFYNNPRSFVLLSKKIHDFAYNTCSKKYSIKKDISLINSFNNKQPSLIPTIVKKPILTVCIPAYNVSKYITQTLAKFLECKNAASIEVLIVNDGSTDATSSIVKSFINNHYKAKGTPIFKIIDKENGGHGSTINAAIKLANGKYFRVLDGDDYFISSELDNLVNLLKQTEVDVVLNEYVEDNGFYGTAKKTSNIQLSPNVIYKVDDCCFDNYGFAGDMKIGFQLHSISIKTTILQSAKFLIDEKCYHDDIEYDFACLAASDTLLYFPFAVYNYALGNPNQSMSPSSIKKHLHMHKTITLRIINEYYNYHLTEGKKYLVRTKLIPLLCNFQYYNMIKFEKDTLFKAFDLELAKFPEFYNSGAYVTRYVKFYRRFPNLIRKNHKLLPMWHFLARHKIFSPLVNLLRTIFN